MEARKYWEVPACPQEKRERMIKEIEGYLDASLQKCYVRTEVNGDNYTTACRMYATGKKGDDKTVLTTRMSFYGTVCKVDFEYNISRVVFNFILAAVTLVTVLPAIIFCTTAILRLRAISKMRKDLKRIMKKYAV